MFSADLDEYESIENVSSQLLEGFFGNLPNSNVMKSFSFKRQWFSLVFIKRSNTIQSLWLSTRLEWISKTLFLCTENWLISLTRPSPVSCRTRLVFTILLAIWRAVVWSNPFFVKQKPTFEVSIKHFDISNRFSWNSRHANSHWLTNSIIFNNIQSLFLLCQ